MLGVQGFKTKFWGEYSCNSNDWVWDDGKLEINGYKFTFMGGKARKPAACIIEEYTEPAKPAAKRMRAICTETGERV
jgi:hypothetical protein